MVAGVDDISAVAGIVSLTITLLHGCVMGFELLCRARRCETQMSSLRLMLEFEEQKLLWWAQEAGLLAQPPKPQVAVQDVDMVHNTMRHLFNLLSDARKLKSYGLEIVHPPEVMLDIDDDTALGRLDLITRPEIQASMQATRNIFQHRSSPWHKLKWVAVDEQRFRRLLDDIGRLTTMLHDVLDHDRGQILQKQHAFLLRTAIASTLSQQDLDLLSQDTLAVLEHRSIAATARLKKRSLGLGFLDRFRRGSSSRLELNRTDSINLVPLTQSPTDTNATCSTEEMRLKLKQLRLPQSPGPHDCRQIAYYDCKPVLLEWRAVSSDDWKRLKSRVGNLASLLSAMDGLSFHSLPCRGYLRYRNEGLYGYVFDLPAESIEVDNRVQSADLRTSDLPVLPVLQTLHAMLQNANSMPSLNVRVSCAIVLFETILQLHTAGWLHKELRSENILVLGQAPDSSSNRNNPCTSMYVGGYLYARADDPEDFTEPAKPQVESELYRHPASLGAIRRTYRKSFDIFSIGCILLELGFWSSLPDILRGHVTIGRNRDLMKLGSMKLGPDFTPPQSPKISSASHGILSRSNSLDLIRLRQELLEQVGAVSSQPIPIVQMLEAQAGKAYTKIVVDCLTIEDLLQKSGGRAGEQIDALEFEQRSLETLRRLVEVL